MPRTKKKPQGPNPADYMGLVKAHAAEHGYSLAKAINNLEESHPGLRIAWAGSVLSDQTPTVTREEHVRLVKAWGAGQPDKYKAFLETYSAHHQCTKSEALHRLNYLYPGFAEAWKEAANPHIYKPEPQGDGPTPSDVLPELPEKEIHRFLAWAWYQNEYRTDHAGLHEETAEKIKTALLEVAWRLWSTVQAFWYMLNQSRAKRWGYKQDGTSIIRILYWHGLDTYEKSLNMIRKDFSDMDLYGTFKNHFRFSCLKEKQHEYSSILSRKYKNVRAQDPGKDGTGLDDKLFAMHQPLSFFIPYFNFIAPMAPNHFNQMMIWEAGECLSEAKSTHHEWDKYTSNAKNKTLKGVKNKEAINEVFFASKSATASRYMEIIARRPTSRLTKKKGEAGGSPVRRELEKMVKSEQWIKKDIPLDDKVLRRRILEGAEELYATNFGNDLKKLKEFIMDEKRRPFCLWPKTKK